MLTFPHYHDTVDESSLFPHVLVLDHVGAWFCPKLGPSLVDGKAFFCFSAVHDFFDDEKPKDKAAHFVTAFLWFAFALAWLRQA
jgi:hypothetical protein